MQAEDFSREVWESWHDVSVSYSAFAKKRGVDVSELYVVDALWDENDGLTQKAICEVCAMGKQTVSAICKRLVMRDFVASRPSESDKRERIMVLTSAGRDWWSPAVERSREIKAKAAKAIPAEDADVFIRVVKQYVGVFREEMR